MNPIVNLNPGTRVTVIARPENRAVCAIVNESGPTQVLDRWWFGVYMAHFDGAKTPTGFVPRHGFFAVDAEGVEWARGWDTPAARALEAAAILEAHQPATTDPRGTLSVRVRGVPIEFADWGRQR